MFSCLHLETWPFATNLPHAVLHRLMCLKTIWKLAMQICHCCTLRDQVHRIARISAIELAHPLMSRHARLAAILW